MKQLSVIICVLVLVFASCTPQTTTVPQVVINNSPIPPTSVPTPDITIPTPAFMGVLFSDSVPQALRELVGGYDIPFSASMNMDVAGQGDTNAIHFKWIYALGAPFPTVTDGVTFEDIRAKWEDNTSLSTSSLSPLLMAESTLRAFTAVWGEPTSGSVRSVDESRLLDAAWAESAWAIVPFESLDPKWKVLTIDGQSPIRKNFDMSEYPLKIDFTLEPANLVDASSWTLSNYDPSKLTTVIMTGVTALVRATALTMELKGSTYPGEKMRDVFREADIMHVSNEIPFFTGCPYPKPEPGALVFCSDPKYMDLLTDIGTDVIELTGNHFADYGPQAMYETLDMYRA
ncbi:MAG TPA: CapA family protein, partial [Anaerolineales bacterium]|nr:CapA family protein [Anaerolineales bacterium]